MVLVIRREKAIALLFCLCIASVRVAADGSKSISSGCDKSVYDACESAASCYSVRNCGENGTFQNTGDFEGCADAMPYCDECFENPCISGNSTSTRVPTVAPSDKSGTDVITGSCSPGLWASCSQASGCYTVDNCIDGVLANQGPYSGCVDAMPFCDECFENPCAETDTKESNSDAGGCGVCLQAAGCYVKENCRNGKRHNEGHFVGCAQVPETCDPCFPNTCSIDPACSACMKYADCYEGWNCIDNSMRQTEGTELCAYVNREACDACFPGSPCVDKSINTSSIVIPASKKYFAQMHAQPLMYATMQGVAKDASYLKLKSCATTQRVRALARCARSVSAAVERYPCTW